MRHQCLIVLTLLSFALANSAKAEDPDYRIAPGRGLTPGQAYQIADIENINMATGGVTLRIPLAQLPAGPGGLTSGATLTYNSKYWRGATQRGMGVVYHTLEGEDGGAWWLRFGYELEAIYPEIQIDQSSGSCTQDTVVELRLIEPDGNEHKLYLKGAPPMPTGCPSGSYWTGQINKAAKNTWYSMDGSFLRLEIEAEGSYPGTWPNADWTLYRPDGSRVEYRNHTSAPPDTTFIDRNGNRLAWTKETAPGGSEPTDVLSDEFSHAIRIYHYADRKEIAQTGYSGDELRSVVYYTSVSFLDPLHTGESLLYKANTQGALTYAPFGNLPQLVSSVSLPARNRPDGQSYTPQFAFEYNARYHEISRMTMPSGATVDYRWWLDDDHTQGVSYQVANRVFYYDIQLNGLTRRTVKYKTGAGNQQDGSDDITNYDFPGMITGLGQRGGSTATSQDGGITQYTFFAINYRDSAGAASGKIRRVTRPDGSVQVSNWATNRSSGMPPMPSNFSNEFIAWEFETAAGSSNLVKTTKYEVDQNGNQTAVEDRDWTTYSAEPTAPEVGTLLRRVETPMVSVTPGATGSPTGADPNGYMELSGTRVLGLASSRSVKNGAGSLVEARRYTYDDVQRGNLTKEELRDIRPQTSEWQAKDQWNVASGFAYDSRGRVSEAWDADLQHTTYSYNNCSNNWRLSSKTVPSVGTTSYGMECNLGVLTSMIHVNNRSDSFTYDKLGRLLTAQQGTAAAEATKLKYAYDDQAQWILERSDVDALGDVDSGTHGGAVSVIYFDTLGRERRTRKLESLNSSDTSAATETGANTIIVDTAYEVNSSRTAIKTSNPYRQGGSTTGWTVTLKDALGRTCAVESYSGSAEPTAGTCATPGSHGGRAMFTYGTITVGAAGSTINAAAVTETINGVTSQIRRRASDGLGQLREVAEDAGSASPTVTTYVYDAAGRLSGVTQGALTRSFSYSTAGWLYQSTNPESGTTLYDYTAGGRLLWSKDARSVRTCMGSFGADNVTCTADYDGAGRPKRKTYSTGVTPNPYASQFVSYTYTGERLTQVSNAAAAIGYSYDALDRVIGRTQAMSGGATYSFSASYKPRGMATETYHGGRVITYSADAIGRVSGVSGVKDGQSKAYADSIQYAPHGGLSQMTVGGLTESWGWNYRLQPSSISHGAMALNYYYCPGTATSCTTNDGNVASQVIGQAGNATQSYTYDVFGRLLTVTEGSAWSRTYEYDRQGNQWVSAWSGISPDAFTPVGSSNFNAKNQLMIQNSHYDDAGNQDVIGGYGMTYDEEGRLATLTLNGVTTTMTYDGEGRRVKKQDGATRTTTMTYGIGGELAQEYELGGGSATGGTQYLAVDHLGSTRMAFDSAGSPTRCMDYIPFGEEIPQWIGARAGACWGTATEPRVRFTGKERDTLADGNPTSLDYFGARYYSGGQGRFTSPDPPLLDQHPEDPQSWNLYSYVRNNPMLYVDPTGNLLELIGNAKEREKALAYLRNSVGDKVASRVEVKEVKDGDTTHYMVRIKGDIGEFMKAGDTAHGLANLVGHKETVEFGLTSQNLSNLGGAVTYERNEVGNANVRVLVNPNQADIATARLDSRSMFGSQFWAPPGAVKRSFTPEVMMWHEFGHAWGFINGRKGPQTNQESLDWENIMRLRLFGPFGPYNARRVKHL